MIGRRTDEIMKSGEMGATMATGKTGEKQPLAHCAPCSEKTPHRYERIGINGRLTSRAICLVCNNDSRGGTTEVRPDYRQEQL